VQTNEVRYVYNGNLVIQERDANNLPLATYTRGLDLSGTSEGAGGIGGLLARTDHGQLTAGNSSAHAYYHSDGSGNVTCLINANQFSVAKYLYDPFGNILSAIGPMAEINLYRFSSKEYHANSGLICYGYRYYEPNLQRWNNADPIGEKGGYNLYAFAANNPTGRFDPWGNDADSPQPYILTDATRDAITGWLNEIADRQRQGWTVIVVNPNFSRTELAAYERLQRGLPPPMRSSDSRTLAQAFRQDLPGILGVPLGGVAQFLGGLTTAMRGLFTWNGPTIGQGFKTAGWGVAGIIGLDESFFREWKVWPGMTGTLPLPESLGEAVAGANTSGDEHARDAQNAMHGWHGSSNARVASRLGLFGVPFMTLSGVGHETVDFGSMSAEFRAQGFVNATLDAFGDIGANTLGTFGGLLVPGSLAGSFGRSLGNLVPGPADLDPQGLGVGGYTGNPCAAWRNRSPQPGGCSP
jgi:RHS repeat-associated protein